jgi:hypothetical protein
MSAGLVAYVSTLTVTYRASSGRMTDDLGRIWKEAIMT